jgi:hypothetical protein
MTRHCQSNVQVCLGLGLCFGCFFNTEHNRDSQQMTQTMSHSSDTRFFFTASRYKSLSTALSLKQSTQAIANFMSLGAEKLVIDVL